MDSTLSALCERPPSRSLSKPSPLERKWSASSISFAIAAALRTVLRLPIQDAEEIVQRSFWPCFNTYSGVSRENLRGWVFRVTHNLALKQREQSRRSQQVAWSIWRPCRQSTPNPETN